MNLKVKKVFSFFKWVLIAVFSFSLLVSVGFASSNYIYQDKILPNVFIGNLDMGGLSYEEASAKLGEVVDAIEINGIEFKYGNKIINITPTVLSLDPGASSRFVDFNMEGTISLALGAGKNADLLELLQKQVDLIFNPIKIENQYEMDEKEMIRAIASHFSQFEKNASNAHLVISNDYKIKIKKEESGTKLDYDRALVDVLRVLSSLEVKPITLNMIEDLPRIKWQDIENSASEIQNLLNKNVFSLKFEDKNWDIYKSLYKNWIILEAAKDLGGNLFFVTFSSDKVREYLENNVTAVINIPPQEAKFAIENNKVVEFGQSVTGRKLNIEETIKNISLEFIKNGNNSINLTTEESLPLITTENVNNLGIKEIIGVGTSNFRGSPANRIHNIKTGANTLHGILIKPNEEFSLLAALGTVDGNAGYRQELVIKEGKTIPEFGGGLCQIGTTIFRTALSSGLPITERRNHSYRVSYYEPAGTDATIYIPKPDLKFVNDTGNYILVQRVIKGNEVSFEFWGSLDGRKTEQSKPKIYNIKAPPESKIIETADLKPGEKKCTEKAHAGADASFEYKVTYPDGTVKEQVFRSHYVPWGEVCLVGIDPNAPQVEGALATPATGEPIMTPIPPAVN